MLITLLADARKFGARGLNVIVTADAVGEAYLADPPAAAQKLFARRVRVPARG